MSLKFNDENVLNDKDALANANLSAKHTSSSNDTGRGSEYGSYTSNRNSYCGRKTRTTEAKRAALLGMIDKYCQHLGEVNIYGSEDLKSLYGIHSKLKRRYDIATGKIQRAYNRDEHRYALCKSIAKFELMLKVQKTDTSGMNISQLIALKRDLERKYVLERGGRINNV